MVEVLPTEKCRIKVKRFATLNDFKIAEEKSILN